MIRLPVNLVRAIFGAVGLWLVGMVVGITVFSVPQLRGAPAIRYLSANPFITIPILLLWPLLARHLTRHHVARTSNPMAVGIHVGIVLLIVNMVLDRAVVVGAMGAGPDFYSYAGVWLGYAMLIVVPWMTGREATRR